MLLPNTFLQSEAMLDDGGTCKDLSIEIIDLVHRKFCGPVKNIPLSEVIAQ